MKNLKIEKQLRLELRLLRIMEKYLKEFNNILSITANRPKQQYIK